MSAYLGDPVGTEALRAATNLIGEAFDYAAVHLLNVLELVSQVPYTWMATCLTNLQQI
jgi:hypothetical protein